MNPYENIRFADDELEYFDKLFKIATKDGPFEGLRAVKFIQNSKLPNVFFE